MTATLQMTALASGRAISLPPVQLEGSPVAVQAMLADIAVSAMAIASRGHANQEENLQKINHKLSCKVTADLGK